MIIELLLDLIYNVMDLLIVLDIPDLPEEVYGYIETAFEYIVAGGSVLVNYLPLGYLMVLFGVILAVDAGILIYHLVMWILRKIPFISIE